MTGTDPRRIRDLSQAALAGRSPARAEIAELLGAADEAAAAPLFAAARRLRAHHFGDVVFLYGFVYFSTYCRNWCSFCYYRRGNEQSPRYRKSLDEVLAISRDLADSGVHLLDLTMGEDPRTHGDPAAEDPAGREPHFEALLEMVAAVKRLGLPVMISPGVVPPGVLHDLAAAGADWYACYQETHDRALYARLRVGQDYDARVASRCEARRAGMLVEDGILLGVGESAADRADSIVDMRDHGVDQARVMGFVPQAGTPMAAFGPPSLLAERLTIAVMRLTMPDRLIPASLDVQGIAGLEPRLAAGANVVTSIVPPSVGLCGVSQSELDIDAGLRTVAGVEAHLPSLGLRAASGDEFRAWVEAAKARAATVAIAAGGA